MAFGRLVIGGRLSGRWLTAAIAVLGCILINVSLFVPTSTDTGTIELGEISLQALLVAGWIALGVMLIQLSRRGWLGLRERGHPFLPAD